MTTLRAAFRLARSTLLADAPGTTIEATMLKHIAHNVSRAIVARGGLVDMLAVRARGRAPTFAVWRNIAENRRGSPILT